MGLKHPPKLCNQLSHVILPLRAESWMSPDWGQEAVRAGPCVTAGALLGVEEIPPSRRAGGSSRKPGARPT